MERTHRTLQLANYGLATLCAVLFAVWLALGRGAVAVAFLVAAVWWFAVATFWGRRARPRSVAAPSVAAWPEPFEPVDDEEEARGLEAELRKEAGTSHPLWRRSVVAIARSTAADDVVFALDGGEVAVVHLTWLGRKERSGWPATTVHPSADAFLDAARADPW